MDSDSLSHKLIGWLNISSSKTVHVHLSKTTNVNEP